MKAAVKIRLSGVLGIALLGALSTAHAASTADGECVGKSPGDVCRPAAGECDEPDTCNPQLKCRADSFVPAGTPCTPDDDDCTSDVCSGAGATCTHPLVADGSACDDANACTQFDVCRSGECTGEMPVTCAPLGQCFDAGECAPATGECSNPKKADGTACDDGVVCTEADACADGACGGVTREGCCDADEKCDDGDACTGVEVCDESSGECLPGSRVVCADDGDPCTDESCEPSSGSCVSSPNSGSPCGDDGHSCTDDVCESGQCRHVLQPMETTPEGIACRVEVMVEQLTAQ